MFLTGYRPERDDKIRAYLIIHDELHIKGQGHGPLLNEELGGSQNSGVLSEYSAALLRYKFRPLDIYMILRYLHGEDNQG